MKKILLFSALIMGFPFVVSAGYSDGEYDCENYSDCDNKDKHESKIEDPLLFDKIFLNQFKTEESRALFLVGFFSSIEKMITDFEHKQGVLWCQDQDVNISLMASLCEPFWLKESLVRIINHVLNDSICSKDFQEKVITQLVQLRDNRANNNVVNESAELFFKEAVHVILSFYPFKILRDNEAGRLLALCNYFDEISSTLKKESDSDRHFLDVFAVEDCRCVYENDALSHRVKILLASFVDDVEIQVLIKKLIKKKDVIVDCFKAREDEKKQLNRKKMRELMGLMAQFCDQAIMLVLDVLEGSKCARYYKPVGDLLAVLARQ